jgi:hypothetical protein
MGEPIQKQMNGLLLVVQSSPVKWAGTTKASQLSSSSARLLFCKHACIHSRVFHAHARTFDPWRGRRDPREPVVRRARVRQVLHIWIDPREDVCDRRV